MRELKVLKRQIVASAALRYRASGRFSYHFARGKLLADPIFEEILARALIPAHARIVDLGCGQGLIAAWLVAAEEQRQEQRWSKLWPDPPTDWAYHGIELMQTEVNQARAALGVRGSVERGDIRSAIIRPADIVLILDVLHYMEFSSQEAVLKRVRSALPVSGLLLLRIGDAGAGLRFLFSRWVDRVVLLLRGHGWTRLHCRTVAAWQELLEKLGFESSAIPMSSNTPFANVLLVARAK